MEDDHKEETQQDATPLPPVDTERRTRSHRQRILPVGTVVQDNPQKISSAYSVFTPDVPAFDSKVHPSDFVRSNGRSGGASDSNLLNTEIATATEAVQVDMKIFPLRFRDATQEEAFCKHFNMYVAGKVRSTSRIVILVHAIMLITQYRTQAQVQRNFVFVTRAVAILLSLFFQTMISTSWFRRHFDRLLLVHYLVLDVVHQLPRFAFLMSSIEEETDEAATDDSKIEELTLFASQKSVRAMNLIFIVVIYTASGMRFTMASICACWHMVVKIFFAAVFCHACTWDDLDATTNCAMIAFCTLTAYHSERYVRQEFVVRLRVDEERKRRDDLLETMLPVHIKECLKDNCTDGLVESYDEVSILSATATDAHEVYKVEAIAETYMCAAGVPKRDPFHCEKLAEMALTMMRICEKEAWNFNGVDIQLQIGIHSGPVVAGVVGSKTYSYHLFGNTVNTSSRVCSSGCAGKIQISARSRQLLAQSGHFAISERGLVNLKGKGMVQLFWLEAKSTLTSRRKLAASDIYNGFETAVEEPIHAKKDLKYKSPLHHRSDDYLSCMKDVEIQPVTLDFRQKRPCKCEEQWLKLRGRSSRIQAAPDTVSTLKNNGESAKDPQSIQSIKYTASEMEHSFRFEHARDSTPQFCMALCMSVIYLVITIIYKVYTTSDRNARAYSIYGITIAILLAIVKLLRKYPRLTRLKEKWGTGTGLVFVLALNIQLLTAADTFKDSQPRGLQKITFLDGNILHAVIAGLATRLRFRNAALINTWGYVAFVVCSCLRRPEVWADMSEGFYLLFVASWIAIHFGYKRELGLRHDFLLKCTLQLEKQKCEDLLTNMLPSKQYAEALMQQSTIVDELTEVTLLYSDMVGFTPLGAKLDPEAICVMLNQIYSAFDGHLDDLGVYKMDTVGDAFIVVGGLPSHKSSKNHAAAIAAFAVEMLREIERFYAEANVELQMRIGIHTGPVVGGVVGIKKPRYLIWGKHTVIANLMESRGIPGRIQLSDAAYTHVRKCPEFKIEERADRVQISESDTMRTYFLVPEHPTVKDVIISHYLDDTCLVDTVAVYALQELQTCLLPSNNPPLSKRLKLSLNNRRQSDQLASSLEDSLLPPLSELVQK